MKLYGVTLTYNESDIVPFTMSYHKRLGFDKLIVYDNESTDNTVELLSKYPFVDIKTYQTNNTINDLAYLEIKNNAPFQFNIEDNESTWLYVGDFDEVLYCNGDFRTKLEELDKLGYTCFNGQMIQPISDEFPIIPNGELVHEVVRDALFWGQDGFKLTLFKINGLQKLQYTPGAHLVTVYSNLPYKSINETTNDIIGFHIKQLGYNRCFNKMKSAAKRLSEINKKCQFGGHYITFSDETNFHNMWQENKKAAFPTEDVLSQKIPWPEGASNKINWITI